MELRVRPRTYSLKTRLEYASVWLLVNLLGRLPRPLARHIGRSLGELAASSLTRLRRVGLVNLWLAFPEWSDRRRKQVISRVFCNLGYSLAEFCLMQRYSIEDALQIVTYDGLDHYLGATAKGRGVLVLTGHLGAWELSSFIHSLAGHPMALVIRHLDNPLVDGLVNKIRCLHGNRVIAKGNFARGLMAAMAAGETVGVLMDTNMTPPEGIFVPFFGVPACTASGLARIALKTGAAVLPGFLLRDGNSSHYTLRFGKELNLSKTDDREADILASTSLFTRVIEEYVREYPDQWLWMHRRWKTRPADETSVY